MNEERFLIVCKSSYTIYNNIQLYLPTCIKMAARRTKVTKLPKEIAMLMHIQHSIPFYNCYLVRFHYCHCLFNITYS